MFIDGCDGLGQRLKCDNPQCEKYIEEGPVAYEKKHRVVMHPGACQDYYGHTLKSLKPTVLQFKHITLEEAYKLLNDGKLAQSEKKSRGETGRMRALRKHEEYQLRGGRGSAEKGKTTSGAMED